MPGARPGNLEALMCEVKSKAITKVDKLISSMDRLSAALERSLDVEFGRDEAHGDAGSLRGSSLTGDLPGGDRS